jgi:hypothetical protein
VHGCSLIYTYGVCSISVSNLDYSANWWDDFVTKELETIRKEVFFFGLSELPTFFVKGLSKTVRNVGIVDVAADIHTRNF